MKEIVELCAIKASYNYYLASHNAQFEVENTTQVQQNLKTLSATLRELYKELKDLNKRDKDEKQNITDQCSDQYAVVSNTPQPQIKGRSEAAPLSFGEGPGVRQQRYLQTMKAIMLFNADKRFTITE
jgi:hypothetical protein